MWWNLHNNDAMVFCSKEAVHFGLWVCSRHTVRQRSVGNKKGSEMCDAMLVGSTEAVHFGVCVCSRQAVRQW
jgi:hypothetical protein